MDKFADGLTGTLIKQGEVVKERQSRRCGQEDGAVNRENPLEWNLGCVMLLEVLNFSFFVYSSHLLNIDCNAQHLVNH